jgi:uncharacterized protein (TIGR02646 family)
MKKVIKNFDSIPSKLASKECQTIIQEALNEKGKHDFKGGYYAHSSVKKELAKIYNNKCAFCENDSTAGAALQVEHYRPKAKVSENNDHSGYYWLGYEWSNLLYACSKCNRAKSNAFPLNSEDNRSIVPLLNGNLNLNHCYSYSSHLIAENPLLLNPEIDSPEEHLIYLPSGKLKWKTEKGEITIKVCKLDRQPLLIARKKLISRFLDNFIKIIADYNNTHISLETVTYAVKMQIKEMIQIINKNESFSELTKYMLKNYEYFFIRRFGNENDRNLLRNVFKETLTS